MRPTWLAPADAQERAAIRQYLFAVRRGLNQKQLSAYKVGASQQRRRVLVVEWAMQEGVLDCSSMRLPTDQATTLTVDALLMPLLPLQFLVGLIILPCGSLWAGVLVHLIAEPLQDERALYSCCILLFLVTTYTLATTTSLVLHDVLMTPRLKIVEDIEIAWRTHDMMFFTVRFVH